MDRALRCHMKHNTKQRCFFKADLDTTFTKLFDEFEWQKINNIREKNE